jgi:hypothetical protein
MARWINFQDMDDAWMGIGRPIVVLGPFSRRRETISPRHPARPLAPPTLQASTLSRFFSAQDAETREELVVHARLIEHREPHALSPCLLGAPPTNENEDLWHARDAIAALLSDLSYMTLGELLHQVNSERQENRGLHWTLTHARAIKRATS